jgi:hypothetical protein
MAVPLTPPRASPVRSPRSGISRQNANQCLKRLEKQGLLRLQYGGVTVGDLDGLRRYAG